MTGGSESLAGEGGVCLFASRFACDHWRNFHTDWSYVHTRMHHTGTAQHSKQRPQVPVMELCVSPSIRLPSGALVARNVVCTRDEICSDIMKRWVGWKRRGLPSLLPCFHPKIANHLDLVQKGMCLLLRLSSHKPYD